MVLVVVLAVLVFVVLVFILWAFKKTYISNNLDTLGIEPRASRMLSGCDTTTPCARVLDQSFTLIMHKIELFMLTTREMLNL